MMLQPEDQRIRVERFAQACRELRLPVTLQRRAIYEAILGCANHPTVDDVLEAVRPRIPGLSRVTVYRILETLAQHGLISRASHRGGVKRYDANIARHHHLVCTRCERTIDLDDPTLDQMRMPDTKSLGFHIADFSIHFSGVCQACRRSATTDRATRQRRNPRGGPAISAPARGTGRRGTLQRRP